VVWRVPISGGDIQRQDSAPDGEYDVRYFAKDTAQSQAIGGPVTVTLDHTPQPLCLTHITDKAYFSQANQSKMEKEKGYTYWTRYLLLSLAKY